MIAVDSDRTSLDLIENGTMLLPHPGQPPGAKSNEIMPPLNLLVWMTNRKALLAAHANFGCSGVDHFGVIGLLNLGFTGQRNENQR